MKLEYLLSSIFVLRDMKLPGCITARNTLNLNLITRSIIKCDRYRSTPFYVKVWEYLSYICTKHPDYYDMNALPFKWTAIWQCNFTNCWCWNWANKVKTCRHDSSLKPLIIIIVSSWLCSEINNICFRTHNLMNLYISEYCDYVELIFLIEF